MSDSLKTSVKTKYGEAARRTGDGGQGCCSPSGSDPCGCSEKAEDPVTGNLYGEGDTRDVPEAAVRGSLGCGNPTALADLHPGEVVLDLGSGGGLDVLLSARRVGPEGKAYGLDMTDEMLELARKNQREAGVENAEFLKGEIEEIPLPDDSVDVVISNCVINLSGDKPTVLREAFRVLKPGGRFAVSDIVVRGNPPEEVRKSAELWLGCIAGALDEDRFRDLLNEVGFQDVEIEPTRVYRGEDVRGFLVEAGLDADELAPRIDGRFLAAFVRGRKPEAPTI